MPREMEWRKYVLSGLCFLAAAAYALNCSFVVIEEGREGVVLTFGAAEEVPLEPGLQLIYPWQSVESLDVKDKVFTQTYQCSSKDLQEVTVEMTVVYRLKKGSTPQIWNRVADRSMEIDVAPGAQEILKAVTAQHNATEIVQERSKLSKDTKEKLRGWLEDGDLELIDCSLAKSSFTPKFDTAIRDKQNALEDANRAINLLAEAKERAKIVRADARGEADAKIEDAIGEAAMIKKSADAEAFEIMRSADAKVKELRGVGLAEALRLAKLAEAVKLNPGVVELEAIKIWQGRVPQYKIDTSKGEGINLLLPAPVTKPKTNATSTSATKK